MIFRCFGFLFVACFACLESSSQQAASFATEPATQRLIPKAIIATASASATNTAPQIAQAPPRSGNQAALTLGSQGPQVVELQKTLKLLGYFSGETTGVYRESTAAAVSKFQSATRLPEATIAQNKAQTSTNQANSSQQFWWLLGILGSFAVISGGIGFAAIRRRSTALTSEIAEQRAETEPDLKETSEPKQLKTEEAIVNALPSAQEDSDFISTEGNSNGHSYSTVSTSETASPKEYVESSMSYVAETSKVSETTRLAKINIVDELIRDLRTPDPTKRHKVIWELGQRGDTRAVQPLVDLMIDSDSKQRSLILSSLSEIGTRTLKPLGRALAISLQDESPDVRKNAIRDLTRVYDMVAQISHLLHQASDDPDQDVQETARWALGQLNRIRSAPTIELPAFRNSVSPPESLP